MTFLGWLQLVIVIVAAGALVGASITALARRRWMRQLEDVAPRPRFALLCALALLPLGLGLLNVAVSFAPSLLDALGLMADHCAHHSGHAFHLCFVHGQPPQLSSLVLGAALVVGLWLVAGWSEEIGRTRRVRVWGERLTKLGRYDADFGGWTVPSEHPVAVVFGLIDQKICISQRLRDILSSEQFEAVVAHERAHAKRHDSLIKLVVRLCAQLHFPAVRRHLLEAIDLACEQACDEDAASSVGDRLTVAEALLAVERACQSVPPPAALAFGTQALERRVRAMLDADWQRPAWPALAVLASLATIGILTGYDLLHHTIESLLAHVF